MRSLRWLVFAPWAMTAAMVSPAGTPAPLDVPPRYRVALTFDDGPRPLVTQKLLALLDRYQVKATFFVVGQMASRHRDLIRLLAHDGQEIDNHSWSHRDIQKMRPQELKMELDLTRQLIAQLTGRNTPLFRAPGGTEGFLQHKLSFPSQYTLVMWDVHSMDHSGLSADNIRHRVECQVQDGDIVLLHSGIAATRDALELIIPHLKARGFEFVTVEELRS